LVIDVVADVTNEGHVPLSSSLIGRNWRARAEIPAVIYRRVPGKEFASNLHGR